MSDYISRADAIVAVCKWCEHPYCESKEKCGQWIAMTILPSADAIEFDFSKYQPRVRNKVNDSTLSADAVPKWNCTANFVAEQLERLREMTDEEKWEFFKRFFEMKGGDDE